MMFKCCTGNAARDGHPVSPATGSGNNTSRDVVIETVHARHADTLPHVTNNCVGTQGARWLLSISILLFVCCQMAGL